MSVLVWAGAVVPLSFNVFRVWWTNYIHHQNVDRVCTCLERLARAGYPVPDVGEALRAVRHVGDSSNYGSPQDSHKPRKDQSRDDTPERPPPTAPSQYEGNASASVNLR